MEAIDLEKLLSDATDEELSGLPTSHPLRTPQCPPTPRFYRGVREGWSKEERRHVSGCEFCQRTTALEWRIECPGLWTLVRYLAEGEAFEDLQAMRRHLERDACRRCALALMSIFVATLAGLLRAKKRGLEEIRGLAEQAVPLYTVLPKLAADGLQFEPLEQGKPFRVAAEGERTKVVLCEAGSGDLEVSVDGADVKKAELEVIGQAKAVRRQPFELRQAGDRWVRAIRLGPLGQQVRELGEDCLVLVAPPVESILS